ncbi:MAG: hypothetical protein WC532_08210 [Candidatus Omnitrophota bacterium]
MKNQKQKTASVLTCIIAFLIFNLASLHAEDDKIPYDALKETAEKYFSEQKYNECAEYLGSLAEKEIAAPAELDYLLALTRYNQLKYLEESQDWNEYFSKGNDYRGEIKSYAEEAISGTSSKDKANVYSRLVLWKLYKDQEDAGQDKALTDLANAALENGDAGLLKDVADSLIAYGERINSRRLYKTYVEKLAASRISDAELKSSAESFYKQQNFELSEALYDAYIGRIAASMPKDELATDLKEIAKQFAYDPAIAGDPAYAEKVFAKMEESAGKESFDEETLYLRAFNLEKAKEFTRARDVYRELINRFPEGSHINAALYKTGVFDVYALRSLDSGRGYFEKLAAKETIDPQVISAIYQLGLLNQWEDNAVKAKEYYDKLLELAKDGYAEKSGLAKMRLKEISESKPLDYNLKLFLDVSLKEENAAFDSGKADLKLTPYILKVNDKLNAGVSASAGESGCMPIDLQYLWSGDLGNAALTPEQHSFETSYSDSGIKQINLIVVSPSGVVGRSMSLADVNS